MGKRSILLFSRKYRLLLGFLSAIIIQSPQYIDSIWSLSERISDKGNFVDISWLYWITIPLGLGLLGVTFWLVRKPVLSKKEKDKITELMESVNALDDKMERCYWDSLYGAEDKVLTYQAFTKSSEFSELWDKCSKQRANINIISSELGEQVRLLLTLLRHSYSYLLKDWHVSELPKYEKAIDSRFTASEIIRKRISKLITKLIG